MSSAALRSILDAALESIAYQMDGLESGRLSIDEWQRGMAEDLITYHYAAYMAGSDIADAADLDEGSRTALNEILGEQMDYLNAFADTMDAANLDPEQFERWRAQADLYAGSTKQSYWFGAAGAELPCYPGGCEECYGNCRCELEKGEDGVYWLCAEDDRSCSACIERGRTWVPYAE